MVENVANVKATISEKLKDFFPQLQNPNSFRLREKLSEKLTIAFHDAAPLNKYQMHDDKEIAIQIIPE